VILLNGKDSAITQIKYQQSKLSILKTAAKYDNSDKSYIPNFAYQSLDNPNLVTIRKELKLDSIAGTGSDQSNDPVSIPGVASDQSNAPVSIAEVESEKLKSKALSVEPKNESPKLTSLTAWF
jgi:hypothetical protein